MMKKLLFLIWLVIVFSAPFMIITSTGEGGCPYRIQPGFGLSCAMEWDAECYDINPNLDCQEWMCWDEIVIRYGTKCRSWLIGCWVLPGCTCSEGCS